MIFLSKKTQHLCGQQIQWLKNIVMMNMLAAILDFKMATSDGAD